MRERVEEKKKNHHRARKYVFFFSFSFCGAVPSTTSGFQFVNQVVPGQKNRRRRPAADRRPTRRSQTDRRPPTTRRALISSSSCSTLDSRSLTSRQHCRRPLIDQRNSINVKVFLNIYIYLKKDFSNKTKPYYNTTQKKTT